MIKITIPSELMDLNNFITAQRTNYRVGNRVKQRETMKCASAFMPKRLEIRKMSLPLSLKITWYCKNKAKDKDNIAFALKFILDGMIKSGAISNDGWKEIGDFSHDFQVDKNNPRIEIEVFNYDEKI
ncbi:RusA family crossover junction endodeoxyribonuclease [Enterococcus songbeiensis]|uniref:RusA family crossover junction endodeoxyribonuclease n=1 Tax=Enterococcus songbeiensis TaxID=2559927 RepID=UPI0010F52CA2|nr:RusA family crossover junction endodeoxyribonuclease [Enterococcus songbeiensis]